MSLQTLASYKTFLGYTSSDRDGVYTEMISEVCDAVVRYCKNGSLESASYTVILDAPNRNVLYLPHFPVTASTLQIWLNTDANGESAAFTSTHFLTAYEDYALDLGPDNVTYSYSGKVTLLSHAPWSANNWVRPVYSLSTRLEPSRGAVKATYTAGFSTIPASLTAAVNLIVSKLYQMRTLGMAVTSEGLAGYNYAVQSSGTADGIIQGDPTIRNLLKPFRGGGGVNFGGYAGAG